MDRSPNPRRPSLRRLAPLLIALTLCGARGGKKDKDQAPPVPCPDQYTALWDATSCQAAVDTTRSWLQCLGQPANVGYGQAPAKVQAALDASTYSDVIRARAAIHAHYFDMSLPGVRPGSHEELKLYVELLQALELHVAVQGDVPRVEAIEDLVKRAKGLLPTLEAIAQAPCERQASSDYIGGALDPCGVEQKRPPLDPSEGGNGIEVWRDVEATKLAMHTRWMDFRGTADPLLEEIKARKAELDRIPQDNPDYPRAKDELERLITEATQKLQTDLFPMLSEFEQQRSDAACRLDRYYAVPANFSSLVDDWLVKKSSDEMRALTAFATILKLEQGARNWYDIIQRGSLDSLLEGSAGALESAGEAFEGQDGADANDQLFEGDDQGSGDPLQLLDRR